MSRRRFDDERHRGVTGEDCCNDQEDPVCDRSHEGKSKCLAIGIALMVPLFVVALPIALAWRGVLALTVWGVRRQWITCAIPLVSCLRQRPM